MGKIPCKRTNLKSSKEVKFVDFDWIEKDEPRLPDGKTSPFLDELIDTTYKTIREAWATEYRSLCHMATDSLNREASYYYTGSEFKCPFTFVTYVGVN